VRPCRDAGAALVNLCPSLDFPVHPQSLAILN
jgi:hypothetical protein